MTGPASEATAYPVLDDSQRARLRRYGTTRRVTAGEILYSPADDSCDQDGFVLTDVAAPARAATARTRLPYETAVDGMFAAGDIRAGSMKRVAAAVGEGSSVIQSVHQYLTKFQDREPAGDGP